MSTNKHFLYFDESHKELLRLETDITVPYIFIYNNLYIESEDTKQNSLLKRIKIFFKKIFININNFIKKLKIHITHKLNEIVTKYKLKKELKDVNEIQKSGIDTITIVDIEGLMDDYEYSSKSLYDYLKKILTRKYDTIEKFETDMRGFIQYFVTIQDDLTHTKVREKKVSINKYKSMLEYALETKSGLGFGLNNFNKTMQLINTECESLTKKMTINDELSYKRVTSALSIATRYSALTQNVLAIVYR